MTLSSAPIEELRDAETADRVQLAALAVLSLLPVGMALASRSATAFLAAAALLSLGGRLAAGEGPLVLARCRGRLQRPLALACLAFAGLAVLSLGWGHHPGVAAFVMGEVALSAGAAFLLANTLPRRVPRGTLVLAAGAVGAACVIVLADLALGLPLRRSLGVRAVTYIYNRPAITILLVYWPIAGLLWAGGRRVAALGLGALAAATAIYCDSGAAVLGAAAGALALPVALAWPRAAPFLAGLGMLGALAIAPVLGDVADRLAPPKVVDGLQDAHARDRIEIWQTFGAAVRARPFLGTGFGTSTELADDPVAQDVPEDRRVLLGVWHAHNGYLQVWTELGLAGATLAGIAMVLFLVGLARLPAARMPTALAATGCAAAIMLVGHGAWQGWWIATLGAAALWATREIRS